MATTAEEMGEVVELPEEEPEELETTDDGGAIVKSAIDAEEVSEFYANIAETLPESELETLSVTILRDIDYDKKARKPRDKQYSTAIRRTGLGEEAPGGATFQGASKTVHPMLAEACIDFEARAIKELMPPNGPVRTFIPGIDADPSRLAKAERKKAYMNWQFLVQMPEFRSELEQLLTQMPLGGSMFLRLTSDHLTKRPIPLFVPLDYILIPSAATNFYSAERQTYTEPVTKDEFEARIRDGMYREVPTVSPGVVPDQTEPKEATDKVQGRDQSTYNEDGVKIVYEVSRWMEIEPDYGRAPYLVSVDEPSRKIVSIVRNWEMDDEYKERMQWIVEFPMIPWRGAYTIGLHPVVEMARSATGALRSLLDSAHIQNVPTLARLKGANFTGQSQNLNATEIVEVEGGVAGENDIRRLLMPIPFKEPSAVLFQLLGFVVDAGRGFVHVAIDKMAESKQEMPVGTTLALIEEGMKALSAIHLRLFHAMTYVIRVLHRIDRMYLTEEELKNDVGEVLAYRSDFQGPLDCIPTADPEIFSDVQRIAQAQIVADRAALMPDLYNRRATEKMLLERAKVPNVEELLIPEQKPERMNQVNENVALSLGQPVAAFPDQEHLSHIQVLLDFLESPVFGQNPIIQPTFLAPSMQHLKEHLVYWYLNTFYEKIQEAAKADEEAFGEIMKERDPETLAELDRLLAQASQGIVPEATQLFGEKVLPIIQKAQQTLQAMQQPPGMPADPNKMAAVEQKRESDQIKAEVEKEKIQSKERLTQAELQADREQTFAKLSASEREQALETASKEARLAQEHAARLRELAEKERAEDERAAAEMEVRERMNIQDNVTALEIASAEIESSERTKISTGKGIDKNPSGGRRK